MTSGRRDQRGSPYYQGDNSKIQVTMKTLDTESEKINKICEILKRDTLEPAEKKAAAILEEAEKKAEEIVQQAQRDANEIVQNAKKGIAQEQQVFHSSLTQGIKQSLEVLKQEIENLFNKKLGHLIDSKLKNPNIVAEIIDALVQGVKTEGVFGSLIASIPHNLSKEEVNHLLLSETVEELKEHPIEIGNFHGGAKLKLVDKNLVLDMSETALKEVLSSFVSPSFRKYFFNG